MTRKMDDLKQRVRQSNRDRAELAERAENLWEQYKNCSDPERSSALLREIRDTYKKTSFSLSSSINEARGEVDRVSRQIDEALKT